MSDIREDPPGSWQSPEAPERDPDVPDADGWRSVWATDDPSRPGDPSSRGIGAGERQSAHEEPKTVALAVVIAYAAAIVAAVVWGYITKWTGYEMGALAWGVGLVVGASVLVFVGRHGTGVLAAGVSAALFGVVLGKYLAFAFGVNDAAVGTGVLSSEMWHLFRDNLGQVFSLYDVLWVVLAVVSTLVILRPDPDPVTASTPAGSLRPASPDRRRSRNPVDRMTEGLPHGLRVAIDWAVTIAGAIAIVLLVKAYVINPYRIPSSSMEPTLHCAEPAAGCEARFSDRVLANRFLFHLRDPRRGEIIVFKTPPEAAIKCGAGGTFVKRLIGLPGEVIELRLRKGDGYIYINGKPLNEPYIQEARRSAAQTYGPFRIPKGTYFMMGDNRSQSCDSRQWGPVPRENLIGKVFATYWPPNRISLH